MHRNLAMKGMPADKRAKAVVGLGFRVNPSQSAAITARCAQQRSRTLALKTAHTEPTSSLKWRSCASPNRNRE